MFPEKKCEKEVHRRYMYDDPEVESYELIGVEGPQTMNDPEDGLGPNQARYYVTFRDFWGEEHPFSVNFDLTTDQFGIIKRSSGIDE